PVLHLVANLVDVVGNDRTRRNHVAGFGDTLCERRARFVVFGPACVGYGEHRDMERDELLALVNAGHSSSEALPAKRIASRHSALPVSRSEPALALFRAAMREAVRHHAPGRLALQRVVADR